MSSTDPWALYARTRDRFVEMLRDLNEEQAARRVPACPEWTVTGVAAHVCGLNEDIAAGRRENLGTAERTAHHVSLRAGRGLNEVCDEWVGYEPEMRDAIAAHPELGMRLAADLVVHLHDTQLALGLTVDGSDEATVSAARVYAARIQDWLQIDLDLDLVVEFTDDGRGWAETDPAPDLGLRVSAYDFLRSVTGRRSRRQVEALDWTGDPAALLDAGLSPYGPLPDDDRET